MSEHSLLGRIVILAGAVMLVAGHGALLYYIQSHVGLSVGALCGVIGIVLVKHVGLLGPVLGHFRRRTKVGFGSRREASKHSHRSASTQG